MRIYSFFIISLLLIFVSCKKDDDINSVDPIEDPTITVKVFYKENQNANNQFPDVDAKVFIYYGFCTGEIMDFTYQLDGKLVKGDSIITPNQSALIGNEGLVVITPEFKDKVVTVIAESNYFGVSSRDCFSSVNKSITTNFVFQ